ncbi:MAG: hypothetical protein ACRDTX_03725 [Pseudonocardiaceae bacterium]
MPFDGTHRDAEPLRDLLVAQVCRKRPDFPLPFTDRERLSGGEQRRRPGALADRGELSCPACRGGSRGQSALLAVLRGGLSRGFRGWQHQVGRGELR